MTTTTFSTRSLPFLGLTLLLFLVSSSSAFLLPFPKEPSSITRLYNKNDRLDKGFNLLEIASNVVPQGRIVSTVKESWKFGWKRMMAELAPQDSKGRYTRPSYSFQEEIGSKQFPDEPGRYHLYVGNPCPVREYHWLPECDCRGTERLTRTYPKRSGATGLV